MADYRIATDKKNDSESPDDIGQNNASEQKPNQQQISAIFPDSYIKEDQNTAEKKKKRKNRILALIIILIFIGVMFTPFGWRGLAVVTGEARFDGIAENIERQNEIKKRAEEELKKKPEFERARQQFETFLYANVDRDKGKAIEKYRNDIDAARRHYDTAHSFLGKGRNVMSIDSIISDFDRIKRNIEQKTIELKRERELMTPAEIREERTSILRNELLDEAGKCFEYRIHSTGLTNALNLFVINGVRRFVPELFPMDKCEQVFKEVGLEVERKPYHDFVVFLLRSDDMSGEKFYGKKSDFNMADLRNFSDISGYFMKLECKTTSSNSHVLSVQLKEYINCNRLSKWWVDDCEAVVVDLRPQEWSKWGIVIPVEISDAKEIFSKRIPVRLSGMTKTVSKFDYHANRVILFKHFNIDKLVEKYNIDKINNKIISPEDLFIQKGHNAIDIGNNFEKIKEFPAAYNIYNKAAQQGNEKGAYRCAYMLLTQKHKIYRNYKDISVNVAEEYLLPLIKSNDKALRGDALNALGVIYNHYRNNKPKAKYYFEEAVKLDNKFAKENLKSVKNY